MSNSGFEPAPEPPAARCGGIRRRSPSSSGGSGRVPQMYAFIFRNTHSSVCKITLRRDFLTLLRRCVRSGFGCSAFRTARPGRRRTALFAGRCLRRRHIAAEASATAEERIFLAEFVCEHVRNIPHFNSIFPARSSFYHLLSPKGGAKSVRRAPSSGSDGGSH